MKLWENRTVIKVSSTCLHCFLLRISAATRNYMVFCRHDLCSWIPTGLVLVRVGSYFLLGSFGEEGRCQATSKARTSQKGCRKLCEKSMPFVPRKKINLHLVKSMLLLIFKWGELSLNWPNTSFRLTFGRQQSSVVLLCTGD